MFLKIFTIIICLGVYVESYRLGGDHDLLVSLIATLFCIGMYKVVQYMR